MVCVLCCQIYELQTCHNHDIDSYSSSIGVRALVHATVTLIYVVNLQVCRINHLVHFPEINIIVHNASIGIDRTEAYYPVSTIEVSCTIYSPYHFRRI